MLADLRIAFGARRCNTLRASLRAVLKVARNLHDASRMAREAMSRK
jgi:hypothetical protein